MPNFTEQLRPDSGRLRAGITGFFGVSGALAVLLLGTLLALSSPGAAAAQSGEDLDELVETLTEQYEVLPLRDGVLLQPRTPYRGVRTIEVTADTLAVNGDPVDSRELSSWMGDRAEPVLELLDLDRAERRRLLDRVPAGAGAAPEGDDLGDAGSADREDAAPEGEGDDEGSEDDASTDDASTDDASTDDASLGDGDGDDAGAEVADREGDDRGDRSASVSRAGDRVVFGSDVRIGPDEVVDKVVAMGGDVRIEGEVLDSVMAFGGGVTVEGTVGGDVVAVERIELGPRSEVGGDVVSMGDTVERSPGARVGGRIREIEGPGSLGREWDRPVDRGWRFDGSVFIWSLVRLMIMVLIGWIFVALSGGRLERLSDRVTRDPIRAGLTGILVAVLAGPVLLIVSVLLAVSVIGIPVLVLLWVGLIFVGVPLLVVFFLGGYSAVGHRVGRLVEGRFGDRVQSRFQRRFESSYALVAWGVVALGLFILVGDFFQMLALYPIASLFHWMGGLIQLVALVVGFGAVCLALAEAWRRRRAAAAMPVAPVDPATPAPPQPPPPPPASAPSPVVDPEPGTDPDPRE